MELWLAINTQPFIKMEKGYPEDYQLAVQISTGDVRAFTILYEKYHSYLYYFALKFLKCPESAEEVVHDVYLKIWESRKNIDPTLSLKGFLIKVCKNHVLNLLKRDLKEQKYLSEILHIHTLHDTDTENAIIWADYEKLTEEAISLLPPQRQKIFRMYRLEEKCLDEIAAELEISKGTVKDHILKATRQMKDFMRKHSGALIDMIVIVLTLPFF